VTPGGNGNGNGFDNDEGREPQKPAFNWGLTPAEPEPSKPSPPKDQGFPPLPGERSNSQEPEQKPKQEPVESQATEAINVADLPTGAMDIADLPTSAMNVADPATVAFNPADVPTAAIDAPTRRQRRMPAAVDPSLEGATEVLGAHSLTGATPEDESVEHDAVSSLFGEDQFVEYDDDTVRAQVPAVIARPRGPQPPRPPIPRGQVIALAIAGGLVAALALVALFLAGVKIGESTETTPVASPTPSAEPTAVVPVVGPVAPGTYLWNELAGGECLEAFASAWEQEYRVIDCAQPHAAQLLAIGQFDDAVSDPYPGVDELASRTAALCSSDNVIDFSAAKSFADLEVVASFAPTAEDWSAGNRDYYCFATRTGGDELTESVAQPQVPSE